MASDRETFWHKGSFAVVGHTAKRNFPLLTYRGLRRLGRTVYPVDPSMSRIEGDRAWPALGELPAKVDAVVLEVPPEDTTAWLRQAHEIGVRDVWIHMGRDTPEALAFAREKGMNVHHGTCAVMYLTPGLTYHSLHKWIMKLAGRY